MGRERGAQQSTGTGTVEKKTESENNGKRPAQERRKEMKNEKE